MTLKIRRKKHKNTKYPGREGGENKITTQHGGEEYNYIEKTKQGNFGLYFPGRYEGREG